MNIQGSFPLGLTGLISLQTQWTLKRYPEHHSLKTSIIQHWAFFIVQLSHLYMTTGKIIAFTILTFVGKLMSLLRNMLFVIALLPKSKCLNFMAAVIVHSEFWSQENKVCHCIHSFSIYFAWSEGSDAMILLFECWVLCQLFPFPLSQLHQEAP